MVWDGIWDGIGLDGIGLDGIGLDGIGWDMGWDWILNEMILREQRIKIRW